MFSRSIILDIAGLDEPDGPRAHQRGGVHFAQALDGAFRDGVAVLRTWLDDVEQQHVHPGIGAVCCDARPHDAGADDGDAFEHFHG
jgi:hypothetical protein